MTAASVGTGVGANMWFINDLRADNRELRTEIRDLRTEIRGKRFQGLYPVERRIDPVQKETVSGDGGDDVKEISIERVVKENVTASDRKYLWPPERRIDPVEEKLRTIFESDWLKKLGKRTRGDIGLLSDEELGAVRAKIIYLAKPKNQPCKLPPQRSSGLANDSGSPETPYDKVELALLAQID